MLGGFRDVVPDMEWGVWDDGALHPEVTAALRAYLPARWPGRLPTEQQQQVREGSPRRGRGGGGTSVVSAKHVSGAAGGLDVGRDPRPRGGAQRRG